MDAQVKRLPNCLRNKCLKTSIRKQIGISDTATGCINIDKQSVLSNSHFIISNPTKKKVRIIAIDRCIYPPAGIKRCDFAFYDNNIFCYVEIKAISSNRALNRYDDKAAQQLVSVINNFRANLNIGTRTEEAIICYAIAPRRPLASTSIQSAKALLAGLGVSLYAGTSKTI